MKVAIIGSRNLNNLDLVWNTLVNLKDISVEEIISGGAKGADSLAEKYAKEKGIPIKIFLPDYKRYGRGAPIKRNEQIIDAAELVIAFWDGKSTGTKNAITLAQKYNKRILIIDTAASRT